MSRSATPSEDSFDVDFDDPSVSPAKTYHERVHPADEEYVPPPKPSPSPYRNGTTPSSTTGRVLPHSIEAEEYLLSCCLLDGADVIPRCIEARITPRSFYDHKHGIIYDCILSLHKNLKPADVDVVAEELKSTKQFDAIGGYAFLTQVSSRIPTTAQAGYFIDKVREQAILREVIISATKTVEDGYNFSGGIDEFISEQSARLKRVAEGATAITPQNLQGLFDFRLAKDGDSSILLGDRYLNRGDMAVLSSTSGMGKSAIAIQIMTELALNRGPLGIKGNGPLRSLMVQSEDSEGDVAEVAASMRHVLNLTDEQVAHVNSTVKIVTDRVNRGDRFIASLRRLIASFKPDLVFINPLQAFIDGDVKDSQDLGRFLREGLNSLNEPASFGYVIIHHTTKPATGKEKGDRQWNEVMYDMAGGAEIINAARAILSLRASEKEGEFNLVLAKRGRRAGVTRKVPQGTGFVLETVTTIPLKHATGRIEVDGIKRGIPVIFWESRPVDAPPVDPKSRKGTTPEKYKFSEFKSAFPEASEPPKPLGEIHRIVAANGCPIKSTQFYNIVQRFIADGFVAEVDVKGQRKTYRLAV